MSSPAQVRFDDRAASSTTSGSGIGRPSVTSSSASSKQREAFAARVDDPGLLRGPGAGRACAATDVTRRVRRARSSTSTRSVSAGLGGLDGLGALAYDGEDRAFDRAQHRFVRRVGASAQRAGEVGAVDLVEVAEHVGETPQDLRRDHARVAAGAHQRTRG